jgi:primosomal protein N' (replication factor Y)
LLTLPDRAAAAKLPQVSVRDLGEGYRRNAPAILTQELRDGIEMTLAQGQQVILFLNRRAYAPFLICRDCGNTLECPNCSVSLSFHRKDRKLRCHHCGFQMVPPEKCPKCQGVRLAPFGAGTEKVEEAVQIEFPNVVVGRLDRDIARRKGALEETLAAFRSGVLQVLVGTQIVAKGLDFPNVTLVGVIAADVSLNIPDFRASERAFQLLSQVAGRAGRGTAAGSVVVQTFNPDHPAIVAASKHEYVPFYEVLKQERREAGYPPFRRLVNVVLSGENQKAVEVQTQAAADRLRAVPGIQVLGPVDCAVERTFGKWRRHILVKLPPYESAAPIAAALRGFEPEDIQIVIDVDPYAMG